MSAPTAERPTGVRVGRRAGRRPRSAAATGGAQLAPATRTARAQRPVTGPRPPQEGSAAVITTAFTMVALVSLWVAAQALLFSGVSHDRAQALLYQDFRTQLAETTAPLGPVVPAGDPVAILSIPAIGLDEVVVEGTASGDTLVGPGHLRSSVLPGQIGSSYVYGRAGTYGDPFGDITDLRPGDVVETTTAQGVTALTVLGVRRDGDPKPPPPAAA
ncbi:MAG: sortase, partial [Actinobacteria bacterium]|nr:sortase [Actinomycetota bacterium]